MAKITPIRISENDKKEYARLVRNTRAKIRRTQKKYGVDLESEVTLPKLGEFDTREEFNKWKEKTGSFTNRYNLTYQYVKNPYGVVASKKELNKIERDTRHAQRVAKAEIKRHESKSFGVGGKQYGTVGDRVGYFSAPDVLGVHVPKDFDLKR